MIRLLSIDSDDAVQGVRQDRGLLSVTLTKGSFGVKAVAELADVVADDGNGSEQVGASVFPRPGWQTRRHRVSRFPPESGNAKPLRRSADERRTAHYRVAPEAVLGRVGVPLFPDLASQPFSTSEPQTRQISLRSSLGITRKSSPEAVTARRQRRNLVRALSTSQNTRRPPSRARDRGPRGCASRGPRTPLASSAARPTAIQRVRTAISETSGCQVSHRGPAPVRCGRQRHRHVCPSSVLTPQPVLKPGRSI